jgi:Tfp pilus assembly protein PilE
MKVIHTVKTVQGLTLIEAMLAILIVGVSVTTLLSLQGVLSRGVFGAHGELLRLASITNLFVKADKDKLYSSEKSYTEKIEDPATTLTYTIKPLKNFSHILVQKVEAQWTGILGKKRQEALVMLRFAPKVKKS